MTSSINKRKDVPMENMMRESCLEMCNVDASNRLVKHWNNQKELKEEGQTPKVLVFETSNGHEY